MELDVLLKLFKKQNERISELLKEKDELRQENLLLKELLEFQANTFVI